jgi:hypothetical protein
MPPSDVPWPKDKDSGTFKCASCGRSFNTKVGLSQPERHDHPLIRKASGKQPAGRKPKGFGQLWTKEEIELIHDLEIRLQGERFIANKMCEYLRNKTNKYVKDKRNDKKHTDQVQRILRRHLL